MESGAHKAIEMRRTKRILKIRKQDSYTRAIGGSFEDEHSRSEARKERSGMKKQDSYLRAVGEVSPDTESKSDFSSISEINIRKQDSYIEAIRFDIDIDGKIWMHIVNKFLPDQLRPWTRFPSWPPEAGPPDDKRRTCRPSKQTTSLLGSVPHSGWSSRLSGPT